MWKSNARLGLCREAHIAISVHLSPFSLPVRGLLWTTQARGSDVSCKMCTTYSIVKMAKPVRVKMQWRWICLQMTWCNVISRSVHTFTFSFKVNCFIVFCWFGSFFWLHSFTFSLHLLLHVFPPSVTIKSNWAKLFHLIPLLIANWC